MKRYNYLESFLDKTLFMQFALANAEALANDEKGYNCSATSNCYGVYGVSGTVSCTGVVKCERGGGALRTSPWVKCDGKKQVVNKLIEMNSKSLVK